MLINRFLLLYFTKPGRQVRTSKLSYFVLLVRFFFSHNLVSFVFSFHDYGLARFEAYDHRKKELGFI